MTDYIVIKTAVATYKCHRYSIKAGKVYFNSRAVNLFNVMSITGKNGEVLYANPDVVAVVKRRSVPKRDIVKRTPGKGVKRAKKAIEVIEI